MSECQYILDGQNYKIIRFNLLTESSQLVTDVETVSKFIVCKLGNTLFSQDSTNESEENSKAAVDRELVHNYQKNHTMHISVSSSLPPESSVILLPVQFL